MKEDTRTRCLQIVEDYLNNENAHDFVKYAIRHDLTVLRTLTMCIDFVKNNCDKETNERFLKKAMPFINSDGSVNEELMEKVEKMAFRIFQKKAGLIDVIDEITPNIHQFLYMVQQLKFYYKRVPTYIYDEMRKFHTRVEQYNNKKTIFNARVENITDVEHEKVLNLLKEKNIDLNNIAYYEAYKYLKRKGSFNFKSR